ncbi:MAG: hypothetical protein WC968_03160 [Bacilli bacterium]
MNILLPLFLTLLVETLIYFFLKPKSIKLLVTVIVLNMILNPAMNLLLNSFKNPGTYNRILQLAEIITVIIETAVIVYIVKTPLKKTLIFSIFSNMGSFLMGIILFYPQSVLSEYGQKAALIVYLMLFIILLLVLILFSVSSSIDFSKDDQDTID